MLFSQIKNEIKYNFIDYKKPVNLVENDFRTATYLGHRYLKQNDGSIPSQHTIVTPCYTSQQKEIRYDYATENSFQFTPKLNLNRTNKANLCMSCAKPGFAKATEYRIFSRTPKPIKNNSVYSKDYVLRSTKDRDYVILNRTYRSDQIPEYGDVSEEGCFKYDTTNMAVYKPAKSLNVVPPGCNINTITVWNYIQPSNFKASDLPTYKIVPNRPIIVQHNGMKSENQSEFTVPVPKKFRCEVYPMYHSM